jgi:hypothetical protein
MEAISFIYVSVDKQRTKELVYIRSSSPVGLLGTWLVLQHVRGFTQYKSALTLWASDDSVRPLLRIFVASPNQSQSTGTYYQGNICVR